MSTTPHPKENLQSTINTSLPAGFVYIEDFLTPDECQSIVDTVDAHQWSHEIQRRQQFYGGQVYYFTPHALASSLQPVSSGVMGELHVSEVNQKLENIRIDSPKVENNETSLADNKKPIPLNQATDLYVHPLEPLNWLVEKLIDHGLFERADVRDPFAEYGLDYSHSNTDSQSISPRLKRIPPPDNLVPIGDINTDPRSLLEITTAEAKIQQLATVTPPQWGNTEFYPDQILVNEYRSKMGIGAHFDDALSFGPQIIGISLLNECKLILSRPQCCSMADEELNPQSNLESQHGHQHGSDSPCHRQDGKPELCDKSCSKCTSSSLVGDIEDCHDHSKTPSTSHHISLRDYSRPDWKVGKGPDILGKYCRCTRQQMFTKFFLNSKHVLNLPVLGADEILHIQQENSLNSPNPPLANEQRPQSQQKFPDTRLTQLKKQSVREELTVYNPHPVPQNQDDINDFLLNYDFGALPHRSFHPRSGEDITTKDQWEKINTHLRTETTSTLDFTPTIEQFNRCDHPRESFEFTLKAGSVYVMSGVSRYQFRHSIPKGSCIILDKPKKTNSEPGQELEGIDGDDACDEVVPAEYRRISLTVRSLLPGRRQVDKNSSKDTTHKKRELFGKLSATVDTTTTKPM